MVTIITGKQGSGKTTKAKEITKGKESVWLTNTYYLMLDVLIKKNTEYIIFDELNLSKDEINYILKTDSLDYDVIICSSQFTKFDFPNANIIEL